MFAPIEEQTIFTSPLNFYTLLPLLALVLGCMIMLGAFVTGWTTLAQADNSATPSQTATSGLATGAVIGLAGGVVGGVLLALSQLVIGSIFWTFASGMIPGITLGFALVALAGTGVWALVARHDTLLYGAVIGLALGLLAFRLSSGATAGYGAELDSGFGPEIGLLIGLVGLLLGALVSGLRARRDGQMANWRFPTFGALIGAVIAGLVALVGYLSGNFTFILPYIGGVTDRQPYPTPPNLVTLGVIYGFTVFIIAGVLLGAVVGLLAALAGQRLSGTLMGLGLLLGALIGLEVGLSHSDVGGPPIPGHLQQPYPYDPAPLPIGSAATQFGLYIGLALGIAFLSLAWLAWRWAEAQPGRHRRLVSALALLVVGALVTTLPFWFHPLFGVSIP